jgi:hypothetical protein
MSDLALRAAWRKFRDDQNAENALRWATLDARSRGVMQAANPHRAEPLSLERHHAALHKLSVGSRLAIEKALGTLRVWRAREGRPGHDPAAPVVLLPSGGGPPYTVGELAEADPIVMGRTGSTGRIRLTIAAKFLEDLGIYEPKWERWLLTIDALDAQLADTLRHHGQAPTPEEARLVDAVPAQTVVAARGVGVSP